MMGDPAMSAWVWVVVSVVGWFVCGLLAGRRSYIAEVKGHNGVSCEDAPNNRNQEGHCKCGHFPWQAGFFCGPLSLVCWVARDITMGVGRVGQFIIVRETRVQRRERLNKEAQTLKGIGEPHPCGSGEPHLPHWWSVDAVADTWCEGNVKGVILQ